MQRTVTERSCWARLCHTTPRHTASKRPGALPSCRCAPAGATGSAGEEPFQGVTDTAEKHTKRREAASGWDPNGESSHVTSGGASQPRGQPGRRPRAGTILPRSRNRGRASVVGAGGSAGSGVGRPRQVFGREGDSGHTRPSGKGRTLALAADLFNKHGVNLRIRICTREAHFLGSANGVRTWGPRPQGCG